ncbi:retrovirus-related pol polyprotein from transposon TNT 1-94 [Tanacetum coccineum]
MARALATQAWLWHRRLSHLNFDYINLLSKKDVVIGLPKLKYVKDQLCSSCEVSKAKRSSFMTKVVPSSKGRLNLFHMDLCGPMQTHNALFKEGIKHQTSTPRTTEQNGVVKRRNHTLVEAARTMLSASKLLLDGVNLDKMKEKGDSCILVKYSTQSKGYRVYNKRTRLIVESIHLRFDEIKEIYNTSVTTRAKSSFRSLPTTTTTNVHAEENNNNQVEDTQVQQDEFINPFYTPVREVVGSSSCNIDNSNMHTFYQPHDSEYRWIKDHPLSQVHGNPSKPVQTRRQLATDPEMCMFALTVSTAKRKNIKEAMADSAWIKAMQ